MIVLVKTWEFVEQRFWKDSCSSEWNPTGPAIR